MCIQEKLKMCKLPYASVQKSMENILQKWGNVLVRKARKFELLSSNAFWVIAKKIRGVSNYKVNAI